MSHVTYDPQWLELERNLGARPAFHGTVSDIREQFAATTQLLGPLFPTPDPSVIVKEEELQSGIKVRVYTPRIISAPNNTLPIGVYYHGGGFVVGDLNADDADCRYLAQHTPCVIVAVGYRLAPECSFAEILKDALEGYEWAWEHAERLSGTQTCVFPLGSSAGGCLALAVTDSLISHGLRTRVCGVVALSPLAVDPANVPAEYRSMHNSRVEHAVDTPVINAQVLDVFFGAAQLYSPSGAKAFVTLSGFLKDFPRIWIATCENDPLRDDGVVLERMLVVQDVVVKRRHYEGLGHVFWIFPQLARREEFLRDVVEGIRFVLQE